MERRTLQGINFIRVRGNAVERARAHAALLKPEILNGALPALAKKNEWLIRRGPGFLIRHSWIQALVVGIYRKLLIPYLDLRVSQEERDAIRASAEEVGLSYETCREILFQPDGMMLLIRTILMRHVLPEWIPGGLPGCTSAVALKSWTKDGRILAGRNFDYLVVGPWEKNASVIFNETTTPGEIPFVSLTTAGVHTGGITAMNREGLTLFTHAHFGRKISLFGRPIVSIGDEVIRTCKTLDQAIDFVRKTKPCTNWAFVLTSARENRAAVIELTPSGIHVREAEDGFIAHSNYFHAKDLQRYEALLCGSYCEDLKGRFRRIREILEPNRNQLQPQHLSEALGDQVDYFSGQERVFGNTVGVVTTVQSVVFDPEKQRFWMANRQESPVGLGDYIEVDVDRFWKQPLNQYEQDMTVLTGYRPLDPQLLEGIRHYREAYRCYHMNNDQEDFQTQALSCLRKAVAAFPSDGHLWIQAGIVAFKVREFKEAQAYFEGSRSRVLSPHVACVRDLYLARCLDLAGLRDRALELYRKHEKIGEPKLRKAFKRGLRRPYFALETHQMLVDLQFPDTFQY
jgi:tetratricopeptide (TPR) repeat protein